MPLASERQEAGGSAGPVLHMSPAERQAAVLGQCSSGGVEKEDDEGKAGMDGERKVVG